MNERVIKDYYGRILGRIKEESNGNQVLTDYYGRILGRYEAKMWQQTIMEESLQEVIFLRHYLMREETNELRVSTMQ